MKKAEIFFALFLLGAGLLMFIISLDYPYSTQFGPGPGFFPVWISGFMILFSLIFLIKLFRSNISGAFFNHPDSLKTLILFIVGLIITIILIPILGLILSLGLFCLFAFRLFDKHSWKGSVGVSVGAMVIFYLIFVIWLKVPLPTGIF